MLKKVYFLMVFAIIGLFVVTPVKAEETKEVIKVNINDPEEIKKLDLHEYLVGLIVEHLLEYGPFEKADRRSLAYDGPLRISQFNEIEEIERYSPYTLVAGKWGIPISDKFSKEEREALVDSINIIPTIEMNNISYKEHRANKQHYASYKEHHAKLKKIIVDKYPELELERYSYIVKFASWDDEFYRNIQDRIEIMDHYTKEQIEHSAELYTYFEEVPLVMGEKKMDYDKAIDSRPSVSKDEHHRILFLRYFCEELNEIFEKYREKYYEHYYPF